MNTEEFLRHVLPRGGNKILALPDLYTDPHGVKRTGWKYSIYQSIESMAEAALQLDGAGKTVYFAVQGFGGWYNDLSGKRRLRTQENVVACRSLYDDFDVDPDNSKKYASREEALTDIIRLAEELKLTPTITSSGGGYHSYFTADVDMDAAVWLRYAALKRDITTHLGMKVDRAVDMDSARILRPIGTHNRKTDTPREVVLVKKGRRYESGKLHTTFSLYCDEHHVTTAPATAKGASKAANPFAAALPEYPPSSAHEVVKHCAALRTVSESRGDVDEPLWRASIGLLKHTVEGETLCHEWSEGHPEYSAADTQAKIDGWNYGPTTCKQFDALIGCAKTCSAAVKSPVQLGYSESAPALSQVVAPPEVPPAAKIGSVIAGEFIHHWPAGYGWNNVFMTKAVTQEDGTVVMIPFSYSLIYPLNRVRTEDGTWALLMRAREANGDWREFMVPTSDIASADMLAKTLAQHEVFLGGSKMAKQLAVQMMAEYTVSLQQHRIGVSTAKVFGWDDDFQGFVIGTKKLRVDKEDPVICGADIPQDSNCDFGTSGTLEQWVANIDRLYNRKGAELMQFALCHALGSPLVKLLGGNYHGMPVALVGESGHGKSSVALIACSAFGEPKKFLRQANDEGSTILAAIKRVASMNNLPSILDEISGRTPDELIRVGYALANGRDKERLTSAGKFATVGGEWHLNSFVTSNESVYELVSEHQNANKVEAAQLRFLEVEIPPGYLQAVFPDIPRSFVEDHITTQYGHAGKQFIQFVMAHREWVQHQLARAREKYNPRSQEDTKERFYTDAVVVALVAGGMHSSKFTPCATTAVPRGSTQRIK